jgi:hypothetical protein
MFVKHRSDQCGQIAEFVNINVCCAQGNHRTMEDEKQKVSSTLTSTGNAYTRQQTIRYLQNFGFVWSKILHAS